VRAQPVARRDGVRIVEADPFAKFGHEGRVIDLPCVALDNVVEHALHLPLAGEQEKTYSGSLSGNFERTQFIWL
jgi:hypothetical protein